MWNGLTEILFWFNGLNFWTSHIADTWRSVETLPCILECVYLSVYEEKNTEEGICVDHMGLPQGFLCNYREAGQRHQLSTSLVPI